MLNKSDFDSLRVKSRFIRSNTLLAFYASNKTADTKLGLSISKKFGNAVRRNRLKRLIREIFRKSEFKNLGVSINLTPNLKDFKIKFKDISDYEKSLQRDFDYLLNSINK